MQSLESLLTAQITEAVEKLFGQKIESSAVTLQRTNPQFEGDITLVVFPFTKLAGKKPEETAAVFGEYLQQHASIVKSFNVVKGFLNLVISDDRKSVV